MRCSTSAECAEAGAPEDGSRPPHAEHVTGGFALPAARAEGAADQPTSPSQQPLPATRPSPMRALVGWGRTIAVCPPDSQGGSQAGNKEGQAAAPAPLTVRPSNRPACGDAPCQPQEQKAGSSRQQQQQHHHHHHQEDEEEDVVVVENKENGRIAAGAASSSRQLRQAETSAQQDVIRLDVEESQGTYELLLKDWRAWYPLPRKAHVDVGGKELDMTAPGAWGNDSLVDLLLRVRVDQLAPGAVLLFSSFWWPKLTEKVTGSPTQAQLKAGVLRVRRWFRLSQVLTARFVVVPVHDGVHWSVLVLCNLPTILARLCKTPGSDDLPAPFLLHLDSLHSGGGHRGYSRMRRWVVGLLEATWAQLQAAQASIGGQQGSSCQPGAQGAGRVGSKEVPQVVREDLVALTELLGGPLPQEGLGLAGMALVPCTTLPCQPNAYDCAFMAAVNAAGFLTEMLAAGVALSAADLLQGTGPNVPDAPHFLLAEWYDPQAMGQEARATAAALVIHLLLTFFRAQRLPSIPQQEEVVARLQDQLTRFHQRGRLTRYLPWLSKEQEQHIVQAAKQPRDNHVQEAARGLRASQASSDVEVVSAGAAGEAASSGGKPPAAEGPDSGHSSRSLLQQPAVPAPGSRGPCGAGCAAPAAEGPGVVPGEELGPAPCSSSTTEAPATASKPSAAGSPWLSQKLVLVDGVSPRQAAAEYRTYQIGKALEYLQRKADKAAAAAAAAAGQHKPAKRTAAGGVKQAACGAAAKVAGRRDGLAAATRVAVAPPPAKRRVPAAKPAGPPLQEVPLPPAVEAAAACSRWQTERDDEDVNGSSLPFGELHSAGSAEQQAQVAWQGAHQQQQQTQTRQEEAQQQQRDGQEGYRQEDGGPAPTEPDIVVQGMSQGLEVPRLQQPASCGPAAPPQGCEGEGGDGGPGNLQLDASAASEVADSADSSPQAGGSPPGQQAHVVEGPGTGESAAAAAGAAGGGARGSLVRKAPQVSEGTAAGARKAAGVPQGEVDAARARRGAPMPAHPLQVSRPVLALQDKALQDDGTSWAAPGALAAGAAALAPLGMWRGLQQPPAGRAGGGAVGSKAGGVQHSKLAQAVLPRNSLQQQAAVAFARKVATAAVRQLQAGRKGAAPKLQAPPSKQLTLTQAGLGLFVERPKPSQSGAAAAAAAAASKPQHGAAATGGSGGVSAALQQLQDHPMQQPAQQHVHGLPAAAAVVKGGGLTLPPQPVSLLQQQEKENDGSQQVDPANGLLLSSLLQHKLPAAGLPEEGGEQQPRGAEHQPQQQQQQQQAEGQVMQQQQQQQQQGAEQGAPMCSARLKPTAGAEQHSTAQALEQQAAGHQPQLPGVIATGWAGQQQRDSQAGQGWQGPQGLELAGQGPLALQPAVPAAAHGSMSGVAPVPVEEGPMGCAPGAQEPFRRPALVAHDPDLSPCGCAAAGPISPAAAAAAAAAAASRLLLGNGGSDPAPPAELPAATDAGRLDALNTLQHFLDLPPEYYVVPDSQPSQESSQQAGDAPAAAPAAPQLCERAPPSPLCKLHTAAATGGGEGGGEEADMAAAAHDVAPTSTMELEEEDLLPDSDPHLPLNQLQAQQEGELGGAGWGPTADAPWVRTDLPEADAACATGGEEGHAVQGAALATASPMPAASHPEVGGDGQLQRGRTASGVCSPLAGSSPLLAEQLLQPVGNPSSPLGTQECGELAQQEEEEQQQQQQEEELELAQQQEEEAGCLQDPTACAPLQEGAVHTRGQLPDLLPALYQQLRLSSQRRAWAATVGAHPAGGPAPLRQHLPLLGTRLQLLLAALLRQQAPAAAAAATAVEWQPLPEHPLLSACQQLEEEVGHSITPGGHPVQAAGGQASQAQSSGAAGATTHNNSSRSTEDVPDKVLQDALTAVQLLIQQLPMAPVAPEEQQPQLPQDMRCHDTGSSQAGQGFGIACRCASTALAALGVGMLGGRAYGRPATALPAAECQQLGRLAVQGLELAAVLAGELPGTAGQQVEQATTAVALLQQALENRLALPPQLSPQQQQQQQQSGLAATESKQQRCHPGDAGQEREQLQQEVIADGQDKQQQQQGSEGHGQEAQQDCANRGLQLHGQQQLQLLEGGDEVLQHSGPCATPSSVGPSCEHAWPAIEALGSATATTAAAAADHMSPAQEPAAELEWVVGPSVWEVLEAEAPQVLALPGVTQLRGAAQATEGALAALPEPQDDEEDTTWRDAWPAVVVAADKAQTWATKAQKAAWQARQQLQSATTGQQQQHAASQVQQEQLLFRAVVEAMDVLEGATAGLHLVLQDPAPWPLMQLRVLSCCAAMLARQAGVMARQLQGFELAASAAAAARTGKQLQRLHVQLQQAQQQQQQQLEATQEAGASQAGGAVLMLVTAAEAAVEAVAKQRLQLLACCMSHAPAVPSEVAAHQQQQQQPLDRSEAYRQAAEHTSSAAEKLRHLDKLRCQRLQAQQDGTTGVSQASQAEATLLPIAALAAGAALDLSVSLCSAMDPPSRQLPELAAAAAAALKVAGEAVAAAAAAAAAGGAAVCAEEAAAARSAVRALRKASRRWAKTNKKVAKQQQQNHHHQQQQQQQCQQLERQRQKQQQQQQQQQQQEARLLEQQQQEEQQQKHCKRQRKQQKQAQQQQMLPQMLQQQEQQQQRQQQEQPQEQQQRQQLEHQRQKQQQQQQEAQLLEQQLLEQQLLEQEEQQQQKHCKRQRKHQKQAQQQQMLQKQEQQRQRERQEQQQEQQQQLQEKQKRQQQQLPLPHKEHQKQPAGTGHLAVAAGAGPVPKAGAAAGSKRSHDATAALTAVLAEPPKARPSKRHRKGEQQGAMPTAPTANTAPAAATSGHREEPPGARVSSLAATSTAAACATGGGGKKSHKRKLSEEGVPPPALPAGRPVAKQPKLRGPLGQAPRPATAAPASSKALMEPGPVGQRVPKVNAQGNRLAGMEPSVCPVQGPVQPKKKKQRKRQEGGGGDALADAAAGAGPSGTGAARAGAGRASALAAVLGWGLPPACNR